MKSRLIVLSFSLLFWPLAAGWAGEQGSSSLLQGRPLGGLGIQGDALQIVKADLPPEGLAWNAPGVVILQDLHSSVQADFGRPETLRALVVQADNNDSYIVEGALDQGSWFALWFVPPVESGQGLRTRYVLLPKPEQAQYLRIRPGIGDGNYSVSRFQAFAKLPLLWPPKLDYSLGASYASPFLFLNQQRMDVIKSALAALGALVLLWLIAKAALAAKAAPRALLIMLGMLCAAAWWNMFKFHFNGYVHVWDFLHYYIGAKYQPELGYSRIYECISIADVEDGLKAQAVSRPIRNLKTNVIENRFLFLDDPLSCKSHFSGRRWQDFRRDIAFFRSQMEPKRWAEMKQDHGYNATPAWGIMGGLLSNLGPATLAQMRWLAMLDPLLLALMWLVVWRVFGWEATAAALIFWGTNYPARFWWTGGSFLRQDWLAWSVIGIALLKSGRPFWAGAGLMYAGLLRIFPGFIIGALALKAVACMWQERRLVLSTAHKRFFLGCAAAGAALVLVSSLMAGGAGVWLEFAHNSSKHVETPLTNNMGLKTVIAYQAQSRAQVLKDPLAADPFAAWKQTRNKLFKERRAVFFALLAVFLLFVGRRAARLEDWETAVLGAGIICVACELTCYYYSILLVYAFLWQRWKWSGFALALLAWTTTLIPQLWDWYDQSFTWMSLAVLVYVVWITAMYPGEKGDSILDQGLDQAGSAKQRQKNLKINALRPGLGRKP